MPKMKKSGDVPEATFPDTAPEPKKTGQRKVAAPKRPEDTVTTTKTAARRSKTASAERAQDDAPVKATRTRKAAKAVPEQDTQSPVEDAVAAAPATPTSTRKPRTTRKAAVSDEAVASDQAPVPDAAEEVTATRRTRKTAARTTTATETPVSEPAAQAEAAPEKTLSDVTPPKRRGRPPKAKAPVAETQVETPAEEAAGQNAVEDTAPEPAATEAPSKSRRGRKPKAAAAEQAGTPPTEQPQPTDPLILVVPNRKRGRPRKTAPVTDLTGVESMESVATPAVQTATETAPEPLVDTAAPSLNAAPELSGGPAPHPVRAANRRGKRRDEVPPVGVPQTPAAQEQQDQADVDTAGPSSTDTAGTDTPGGSPAREIVVAQLRKLGRPVHVRDLERTFTRQTMNRLGDWRDLSELLESLVESGEVIRTRKKTYGLPEAMSLVRGKFQASAAGFGFVVPDSGGDDYYIPAEQTLEAWNGDVVLVRMEGRGDTRDDRGPRGSRRGQRGDGNPRASVVRIVQRAYSKLVGTLEFSHGHPILRPDDHRARHRILLLPEGLDGLEAGARVVTELFWPENSGEDEVFGQVVRVLGAEDDPETETEAVIVKYGLRGEFPPEVEAQAAAIPTQIPPEALRGRLDLREFNIFTVDGRDAKDFDDAIHIQPTPEGTFVVGIHIADVSHYVREGSPLDEEAYARATSVYLPGRVLPMLPEHLSNGVCSLVPYEDRLTLTAMVELSAEGDILNVQLAPSVINSKARLTYDEVQAYSEATATLPDHARHLEGDLHLLLKITTKLRQKRLREGSLDFKMREVKVDVGPDGRMELIPIREETARGMIEDLMLLANKVVAHELLQREIPTLFRIHEEPTLQRFQEVTQAIGRLGFSFPGGEPTPQAYQAVLKQVRGTNRESVVNTLLLRSMQQAKYAGENLGHFGLAFDEYLHFTSPIRRYPDLLVHRVLKGMLSGQLKARSREVAELQARLPGMGEHTSERERGAAEAERDLTKYYQAKWAQEHLHQTFPGNVSGVVASGLFVALENGVEGKLHISHLDDDYYIYLEDAQMLRGRSNGRTYRLGDPITVTISAVNPLARMIDFTQENDMETETKPRARRREDREAERREKLSSVTPSAPRKFTLEDPQPARSAAPSGPRQGGQGGRTQNGRGYERAANDRGRGGSERSGSERGGRTFGGVSMGGGAGRGGARRIITLERPRNEHLRPVNITVQRMYFGDWTLDNMPPEEQGGGRGGRFERGDRFDRGQDRGGERTSSDRAGRGYTRGGNDRGAVSRVNGRAPQAEQGAARPQETRAPQAAPAAPATDDAAQSEDAKRRRRRRGRRGGNGAGAAES